MQDFVYDPDLVSALAMECVDPEPGDMERPWTLYHIAGVEAYAWLYNDCHLEDIIKGWDEVRGDLPTWDDMSNQERHMVLVAIAHWHHLNDTDILEDGWPERIVRAFKSHLRSDPSHLFRKF